MLSQGFVKVFVWQLRLWDFRVGMGDVRAGVVGQWCQLKGTFELVQYPE